MCARREAVSSTTQQGRARYRGREHKAVSLVVRRDYLEEEFGRRLSEDADLSRRICGSPLLPALRDNLGMLARHSPMLATESSSSSWNKPGNCAVLPSFPARSTQGQG